MNEEELQKDILFQIDMQLYDEFNDKMCEINEHLGDIYSNKDLEDIKEAENAKERKLLREAVQKQQKEIEKLKSKKYILNAETNEIKEIPISDDYISKDKIKEKMRGEINKSWRNTEQRKCQFYAYDILKELLGE